MRFLTTIVLCLTMFSNSFAGLTGADSELTPQQYSRVPENRQEAMSRILTSLRSSGELVIVPGKKRINWQGKEVYLNQNGLPTTGVYPLGKATPKNIVAMLSLGENIVALQWGGKLYTYDGYYKQWSVGPNYKVDLERQETKAIFSVNGELVKLSKNGEFGFCYKSCIGLNMLGLSEGVYGAIPYAMSMMFSVMMVYLASVFPNGTPAQNVMLGGSVLLASMPLVLNWFRANHIRLKFISFFSYVKSFRVIEKQNGTEVLFTDEQGNEGSLAEEIKKIIVSPCDGLFI